MHTSLLLTTTTVLAVVSASARDPEQNCVRMVMRTGEKSYISKESTCSIYTSPCICCWCQRAHKEEKYVQNVFTYYYMEAECCDGYREIRGGICEAYPEVFFQLFFTNGYHNCPEWKSIFKSYKVAEKFSEELNRTLRSICSCNNPTSRIDDVQLLCIGDLPGVTIFQGRLFTTDKRNSSQLTDDVRRVASEKSNISLLGRDFTALDNCTCCNIITESDLGSDTAAKTCINEPYNAKSGDEQSLTTAEDVAIGTSIFGLIAICLVALLVGYVCWKKRRQGDYQDVGHNHGDGGPGRD